MKNIIDKITTAALKVKPQLRLEATYQVTGWTKIGRSLGRATKAIVRPTKGIRNLAAAADPRRAKGNPILGYLALIGAKLAILMAVGSAISRAVHPIILIAVAIGVARALGAHQNKPVPWHSAAKLSAAMIRAGIIPRVKDGLQPVVHINNVHESPYGTLVHLRLPTPLIVADVTKHSQRLARELHRPDAELEIGGVLGTDPGNVEIFSAKKIGTKIVTLPAATDVNRPIALGADRRGTPIEAQLILPGNGGQCVLIGGSQGSGKSYLIRRLAAHYLLDPNADVHIFGGKGTADYAAAEQGCHSLISAHDQGGIAKVVQVINQLLAIVREHNRPGGKPARPTLLILDEFQAIFSMLSNDQAALKEFEETLFQLMCESRAAYMSIVLASQQLRADTIPKRYQALCQIRINLACRKGDAAIIHGESVPDHLPRPVNAGQAIIYQGGTYCYVITDHMTDSVWQTMGEGLHPVITDPVITDQPDDQPITDTDPLIIFARDAINRAGEITPAELLELLPEQVRPRDAARLGKALGARGCRSVPSGKRRVYSATSSWTGEKK